MMRYDLEPIATAGTDANVKKPDGHVSTADGMILYLGVRTRRTGRAIGSVGA
jgi:hypothetical protein